MAGSGYALAVLFASAPAYAVASDCLAMAQGPNPVQRAGYMPVALEADQVRLTFLGHATFLIESPGGIRIATDFDGYAGDAVPDVVTMNHAHTSHYTDNPDPAIKHVLRGWTDDGQPAQHNLTVGDVRIRNVTTDIRGGTTGRQADANSIFIFEVAGLCIGHLGHLHYELTDAHYTEIGRLDIVMVPVDGGLTMGADSMSRIIKRLRSSLILPMHQPRPLANFLSMFGPDFDVVYATGNSIDVSMRTLPKKPQIFVAKGMQ